MKIGLIRCSQTEEMCPASRCLEYMRDRKGAFAPVRDEIVVVGVTSCGGCPGKKAGLRAASMRKRGAEAIAMASCITLGTPIGFPCPFHKKMQEVIRAATGDEVPIFDYTHEPSVPGEAERHSMKKHS